MKRIPIFIMLLAGVLASSVQARDYGVKSKTTGKRELLKPTAGKPTSDLKVHDVGNMWLSVTNYGQFGSAADGTHPSCEFPANSDVEYLFYAGMWIGALVDGDTMVTVATDGWSAGPGGTREALLPGWTDADTIIHRTIRQGSGAYDSAAVSEQDFIAVYTDTSASGWAFEGHRPMGVKITQKSYAWSYSYAEDFVIFDFLVENVSREVGEPKTFEKLYMGIYVDGDVGHTSISGYYSDDITGFLQVNSEGDTVNLAWIKDNDGDNGLTPGVTGIRVLFPDPRDISYNWWDPPQDWGPTDPSVPGDYGHTPETPGQQYRVMSNGVIDPDQTESNAPSGINTAGMDTRYFLSFGPFELLPDSTLKLTLAYLGGVPGPGYDEFDDIGRNARWARDVYDNPPADGIPDFQGPPPPPSPALQVTPGDGQVTLRWDDFPESAVDLFSHIQDFEGYRVYRSRTGILADMQLLGEFDRVDGFGYDFGLDALNPTMDVSGNDTTITYTYVDRGLTNGEFFYYAVTAYDSGFGPTGLEPLESSAVINMTKVAPSRGPTSAAGIEEVLVVPNPYRLDAGYFDMQWESGRNDTDRRIDFTNLPDKCTIKIFTLAGDLVDTVEHDYPGRSVIAHRESWNMVSRNIQAIASGIYIFTVESEKGDYVGKFVVIN